MKHESIDDSGIIAIVPGKTEQKTAYARPACRRL
jgi:hypothetical protein